MPPNASLQPKLMVTRTMAFALSSGIVIFLGVSLFLGTSGAEKPNTSIPIFIGISAALWATAFVAGKRLFRQQLTPAALGPLIAGLDDEAALHALYPRLQIACLMRWALLEGAALFACVTVFLFHQHLNTQPALSVCVALAIASAGLILLSAPSESSMRELLRTTRRAIPAPGGSKRSEIRDATKQTRYPQ